MPIIGESWIAVRPLMTGFGTATKLGIAKELGSQDLFGSVASQGKAAGKKLEDDIGGSATRAGDVVDKASSRIGKSLESVGTSLGNWGIPFSGAITKAGKELDGLDSKGQKFRKTLGMVGGASLGVGAAIGIGIGAESVHLAAGLDAADGQIASHENISVKAAANIGKAFESSAGTTVFSANAQSQAFAPVSGALDQISGHALTAAQSLTFMSQTGDLAEASGESLGSTTKAVASIMQGFQIPLSGTEQLTNQLFNTSRITGVGVDALGSTIDRLKARLGVAAPTVSDLSSLLVDLNEHGVQGSRGLMVVNTAITTLLQSVPKVDAAQAALANTTSKKLGAANTTVANATSALATAQTNAAAKVADAQQRLVDAQDKVTASKTASAPTEAQLISIQSAQAAVSDAQRTATESVTSAQTRLATAQGKVVAVTTAGAAPANAQVAALEKLGLKVYDTQGKFVGMRDIIAQLQPKLANLTQEQQLATLTQVFGASASKSLLDTVLAGPAAYDRSAKSVNDSSTAHKAAAIQNQNFNRQLEILKSSLIDEGDKIGNALIPKLEDLGRWTVKEIAWAKQHKGEVEAVAGVIGGVLTLAIGTFVVGAGLKFGRFVSETGKGIGDLATKISQKSTLISKSNKNVSDSTSTTAKSVAGSQAQISDAASGTAGAISGDAAAITSSMDKLSGTIATLSDSIAKSIDRAGGSFSVLDEGSVESSAIVKRAMGTMTETVEADTGLIIVANERAAASFVGLGASSAIGAGELAAGRKATTGLADLRAAGSEEATVAPEAELAGGGVAKGLLTGVAGKAVGGLIAVQMYNAFAEKPLGKIIGKDAASTLGDAGTGAAIGFAVGGPLGAAAGGALGVAFAQRSKIAGFLGISGDLAEISRNNAEIAKDHNEDKRNEAIIARSKTTVGKTEIQGNRQTGIGAQVTLLTQLQQTAATALSQSGSNSQAYKTALSNLYSTENKWLPSLKDTSTKGVESKLQTLNGNLARDKSTQASYVANGGNLAFSKGVLTSLKGTLATEIAGGASESTLKGTRQSISEVKDHIDGLRTIAKDISRDTTAVKNTEALKAAIDKTNLAITALKTQIKTQPPPAIQSKGKYVLKWSK